MKYIFTILIISVALFAMPINKKTILNISQTYGYYQGQLYTLNIIEKKYPKLSNSVFMAKTKFDLTFLDSIKNIDTIMGKYPTWQAAQTDMIKSIHEKLDHHNLTYAEAEKFINTVKKRAKGDIESPVLETLLMLNPTYEKHPEQEFYDGFKNKYLSDNLKKSKGINFSLEVPKSWLSREANRPNIVRKFISQHGYGQAMVMVLVLNFPGEKLYENDIKKMLKDEYMKEALPPGAVLKGFGYITLETLPGYWQRYSMTQKRLEETITMDTMVYTLFYKNKIISIQGSIGNLDITNSEKKFILFEPLFKLIVNSFVLQDLYQ